MVNANPPDKSKDAISSSSEAHGESLPRVLIVVRGGVADFVADPGVEVEIFDFDDYASDPLNTEKPSPHFSDLADLFAVPTEPLINEAK